MVEKLKVFIVVPFYLNYLDLQIAIKQMIITGRRR